MTTALQLRRGTTSQHSTFTGANGEVTIDTTKKTAVVHDGVTPGGTPLAKEADAANKVRFDVSTQGLNATQQSNARTNIGATKDPGANGWIVRLAGGDTAARTLVAGSGISISNVDGTAGNPTISNSGVLSVNGQTGNVTVAVDTSNKVSKSGDTMTGTLTTPGVSSTSRSTFSGSQNSGIANGNGGLGGIEVYGGGGASFIAFHRPGTYAVYFGLDTDNQLKVGGWSMGNAAHTVWHSGNWGPVTSAGWRGSSVGQNANTSTPTATIVNGIYFDAYGRVTSVATGTITMNTNCNCNCCS